MGGWLVEDARMHCINEQLAQLTWRFIFKVHENGVAVIAYVLVEPEVGHVYTVAFLHVGWLDELGNLV